MDESEVRLRVAFLAREPLFHGLNEDQLKEIAEKIERKPYAVDDILLQEEDGEQRFFFLVFSGKVALLSQKGDEQQQVGLLLRGSFYGQDSLLYDQVQPYSAQVVEDCQLLVFPPDVFGEVLEQYPEIRKRLLTTAHGRKVGEKVSKKWTQPDETTLLVFRKHVVFLFLTLLPPFLLIPLAAFLLVYAFSSDIFLLKLLSYLLIAASVLGMLWRGIDWGNDYYIVTTRRVLWLEKVIALYDSRTEAPLSSVISCDVRRSFWGQVFDYGDVDVRTYYGTIKLHNTERPYEISEYIDRYKGRVTRLDDEKERKEIRQAIKDAVEKKAKGHEAFHEQGFIQPKGLSPQASRANLVISLKNMFKMRFEEGEVITYRKHWYALVGKIWWRALMIGVVIAGAVTLSRNGAPGFFIALLALAAVLLLGWPVVYRIWDWHNDIFQLTSTQVVDIEKKPLGEERKKTANLDAPDIRVEHDRPNLLATIFNFGNVTVFIGQTPFNIEGVLDPDQVHQEIANRREAIISRRRKDEEIREKERMVKWLMAYHDEVDQSESKE